MKEEQLIDFIRGKITDQSEMGEIMEWIGSTPENHKIYNEILNSWALSGINQDSTRINVDQQYLQFKRKNFRIRLITDYLKYAAAVIIVLSLGALTQYLVSDNISKQEIAWHEVTVPYGQSVEMTMCDSTKVWLNSGSKFRYASNFSPKSRVVELNGEAFFDVANDKQHPFVIKTTQIDIKVTGTSFNVDAYGENDITNITLVEGKVAIQNKIGKTVTELTPNMNAEFNKTTSKLDLKNVNVDFYTTWKTGTIVFREESLGKIAEKLGKWYNVKIVFEQEDIKDIAYSGSILKNKPIDQILEILTYTSGIGYSIESKNNQQNIIHLKHLLMKK